MKLTIHPTVTMEADKIRHVSRPLRVISEVVVGGCKEPTIREISKSDLADGGIPAPLDHSESRTLISLLRQI